MLLFVIATVRGGGGFLSSISRVSRPFFFSEAKPSDLGTFGVVLVVVVDDDWGGPLLELIHVQFFRGEFKSCQIF